VRPGGRPRAHWGIVVRGKADIKNARMLSAAFLARKRAHRRLRSRHAVSVFEPRSPIRRRLAPVQRAGEPVQEAVRPT